MQAWPRPKAGEGGPVERSLAALFTAYGERAAALDLAAPRSDLNSDWAIQGNLEIAALHNSANGYAAWCSLFESHETLTPVIQWDADQTNQLFQIDRMMQLGRGLVFRLKRSQGWSLDRISALAGRNFENSNLLLIFDCEQIGPSEDITAVGTIAQNAILSVNGILNGGNRTFVLSGSSFPSSFADINPSFADLPMRERQLFELLRYSPPLLQAGINLEYGDHAAVFAAERPPAFRGAPRVDYPTNSGWIYHRSQDDFSDAATRVRNDPQWDDDLLCWGSQRIRTAAGGDMTGLNSQSPWVAIRINIHLHRQAHAGANAVAPVEEEWTD